MNLTPHAGGTRSQTGTDLGFGEFSSQRHHRLVNRDGSLNVQRAHRSLTDFVSYDRLLLMSWPRFFLLLTCFFVILNGIFGAAYLACGKDALALNGPDLKVSATWRAFFFSVHTFATIGYGNIIAVGLPANLIVTVEALIGLLTYAIATGLLFARFARPLSRIRFSQYAAISPTSPGVPALQIRLTNPTRSEMIQLKANLVFSFFDDSRTPVRRYIPLTLDGDAVAFMPLVWTLVHPIDNNSPLFGLDAEHLQASRAEILLNTTGIDEVSAQTVYSRISYTAAEIVWNAKHADIYIRDDDLNLLGIDLSRFDEITPVNARAEAP
jgi:inward rectifier potassium channel